MKFYSLILFTFLSFFCSGQKVLIKNDGQQIVYKKLKSYTVSVELTADNDEKLTILKKDIFGFYHVKSQKMFYKKPIVPNNEKFLIEDISVLDKNEESDNGFQLLERVIVGKITLYKKEVTDRQRSNGTTQYFSTTYYYAEKDQQFANILITGLGSKKDDLAVLRTFVDDDEEISGIIGIDNFPYNEKMMLKIINRYNLKFFEKPSALEYEKTGSVNFYSEAGSKRRASLSLKVNDSIEYVWPDKKFLTVKLPLKSPSKVCVSGAEGTTCRLLIPLPYASEAYELDYSEASKSFEIENRTAQELQNYIRRTQSK